MHHFTKQALVLVGGFGTRLKELFPDTPKPLVPVNGRPFLDYLLKSLATHGISEVILLTHFRSEDFVSYARREVEFKLKIQISEEKIPLGSAGAIWNCAQNFSLQNQFLLANGDTFFDGSLNALLSRKLSPDEMAVLGVCSVSDVSRFGKVELTEANIIRKFSEKGAQGSGWVNSGLSILSKNILSEIAPSQFKSLEKDIYPKLILRAEKLQGRFFDIGLPSSYAEFNSEILNKS